VGTDNTAVASSCNVRRTTLYDKQMTTSLHFRDRHPATLPLHSFLLIGRKSLAHEVMVACASDEAFSVPGPAAGAGEETARTVPSDCVR
jgi:hypothetical protein